MKPAILVTGAAGGLAQILVGRFKDRFDITGVDMRNTNASIFPGEFHRTDYTHRRMEDIFASKKFQTLIHLGRVRETSGMSSSERYNANVLGTRNILRLALQSGIERVIVMSTYHVYGAHQHNHLHITEDEPLRATQIYPELSDAVELDHYAKTFSLQYPQIHTVILRPVNIIGPRIKNTISNLLRSRFCPMLLGYDPMMQFLHEDDIAQAVELCIDSSRSGVYNVAGEGLVPYSKAIELAGATPLPVPHVLAYGAVRVLASRDRFPKHLLDYFRYPVIVADEPFRKDFGFEPKTPLKQTLNSIS